MLVFNEFIGLRSLRDLRDLCDLSDLIVDRVKADLPHAHVRSYSQIYEYLVIPLRSNILTQHGRLFSLAFKH